MANKTLNTRIIQKHDIEANWKKATNFIPMKGEVIIYDAGLVEEGKPEVVDYIRIKIGDGETNVNNLPFFAGAGGAGAAVVCNFVGYEGDETGETDTAIWNAAM